MVTKWALRRSPVFAGIVMLVSGFLILGGGGCSGQPGSPGDGSDVGPVGGTGGGGTGGGGDGGGEPISEVNAEAFAEEFAKTVSAAVDSVLNDAGFSVPKTAQSKSGWGPRLQTSLASGVGQLAEVVAPGFRGQVRARGLVASTFFPPRYELTLVLSDYATSDALTLNGTVEYNFVRDDRSDPPLDYGLQRGVVTLSGRFRGEASVQAYVVGGARVSTVVTSGATVHRLGDVEPPGFVTFVSTLAGTGESGFQDGPATEAMFNYPTGVAVDDEGRVYVADQENDAIREIDVDGTVSTVTTDVPSPYDVGFDNKGKLVVSSRLSGHGRDDSPLVRLTVRGDARGAITPIISGTDDYLDSGFPLCPIATHHSCDGRSPIASLPWATGIDVRNEMVLVAQSALGEGLKMVLPDGYLLTLLDLGAALGTVCDEASPGAPVDLALGYNGEIYFTTGCHAVRVYEPDGAVRTLAGRLQTTLEFADGIGDEARFAYPKGLAFDGERYLYVADFSNALIRRVDTQTGETVRVAGCLAHAEGFDCTDQSGFRDGPGDRALFAGPNGMAADRWGDLYVADARNHAVRLVRIVADPDRAPSVHRFDPAVMQQGDSGTLTIRGRNLTTVESLSLGEGITVTIEKSGYQRVTASIAVGAGAEPGARKLSVRTAYGEFTTADDLAFTVLRDTRGGVQVETIAGTGSADFDRLNYGSARSTTFAFPGGIHAISADRLLVADPLEQRIRLIASRVGAVDEFFELLVYSTTGSDVDVLGAITGTLDTIQTTLDFLGLGSGLVDQTEDTIRSIAEDSVDAICETVGAENCDWLSLPWAGLPYVPGRGDGFRLNSTYFLPTDIWADYHVSGSRFYIADAGNSMIRVVGYDIEHQQDAPMQVFSTDPQPDYPFAVTPLGESLYTALPASLMLSQLSTRSGAVNGDWASIPRGVPLGIATDAELRTEDRTIFVADPLNATIWRVTDTGGVAQVKNLRGVFPSVFFGDCMDGPGAFATWGAPMDVAVSQTGAVYVADAGCNSIRVIKDAGFGQDLDGLVENLRGFVASNRSRISAETAQRIEDHLRQADTTFLDDNRFTVTTLAGSADGLAGFADGSAAAARFDAPTSLAIARTGHGTVVFVADTGNRRIRRIIVP